MSATPRPWIYEEPTEEGASVCILRRGGRPLAYVDSGRADALLIVQAVNAHDDLVEACEAALVLTLNHARPATAAGYTLSNHVTSLLRAALAKAGR